LDFDAILAPGHVAPIVIPTALAVAEGKASSGRDLLTALAVAHEMSFRIGVAMDGLRDVVDGALVPPKVAGSSSIIFGATTAAVRLEGWSRDILENALGIAACISPVNYQRSWMAHMPPTTLKYMVGGAVTQSALTAGHLAHLGHTGDAQILDDTDLGYPRFVGTRRWDKAFVTAGLGQEWRFPQSQTFKPYPSCRVLHPMTEALIQLLTDNDIRPDEIDRITVWGEALAEKPVWRIRTLNHVSDSQTSVAHNLAVAAQRLPIGRAWQNPALVFDPKVKSLADRVTFELYPGQVDILIKDPSSRAARVEVIARGTSFTSERQHPRGTPSADPRTRTSTDELVAKFMSNGYGVLPERNLARVVELVMGLENVDDVGFLTEHLRTQNELASVSGGVVAGVAG
jgi:2-methylcitrate dehydratase PrpD